MFCLVVLGWEQCFLCQFNKKEEAAWQIHHEEFQEKGGWLVLFLHLWRCFVALWLSALPHE